MTGRNTSARHASWSARVPEDSSTPPAGTAARLPSGSTTFTSPPVWFTAKRNVPDSPSRTTSSTSRGSPAGVTPASARARSTTAARSSPVRRVARYQAAPDPAARRVNAGPPDLRPPSNRARTSQPSPGTTASDHRSAV